MGIQISIANAIGAKVSSGASGTAPVNLTSPVISGTNVVGQTLNTTNGTWSGSPSPTFTYQWKRDGSNISSATLATYVLVEEDADTSLTCEVTATNPLGSASATSNTLYIFTAEYKAVLDRGTALSYTLPTTANQQKQNKLLKSMKADGSWAKLDVFYVFAVDNNASAFATLNWKNPNSNQSTLVNSPTFTNNAGFTGNGTSSYIDTNFNPSTQGVNYTLNNASMYFFPHAFAGTSIMTGTSLNDNRTSRGSSVQHRLNSGGLNLLSVFDFTSVVNPKSIHRTSATNLSLYNAFVSENRTVASVSIPNSNIYALRSQSTYGAHTCAAFAAGAQLTAENTDFNVAWSTYKSSL